MSFIIELSQEALIRPTRLDVGIIESAMLWPAAPETRAEFLSAVRRHYIEQDPDRFPAEILAGYVKFDRTARSIEDFRAEAAERVLCGVVAGARLFEPVIAQHLAGRKIALSEFDERLSAGIAKHFGVSIRPRSMNNLQGPVIEFRPVAHLFAAYQLNSAGGDLSFPCSTPHLGEFLATAEHFRNLAEKTLLPRSNHPVLRRGEAAGLNDEIREALPQVEFVKV